MTTQISKTMYCNFCGDNEHQIYGLVASAATDSHICDRCVVECVKVMLPVEKFSSRMLEAFPNLKGLISWPKP